MKTVRKLGAIVALTFVLGLSALGGEISTPPCAPGQVDTPPCAMAQAPAPGDMGTPEVIGQMDTPPAARDASFTEIAANVLLGIMSLF